MAELWLSQQEQQGCRVMRHGYSHDTGAVSREGGLKSHCFFNVLVTKTACNLHFDNDVWWSGIEFLKKPTLGQTISEAVPP